MSEPPTPPRLAELLLRAFLKPNDFESVSGDLLEQYRDTIYPRLGERRADLWYLKQLLGFLPSSTYFFTALFSTQFLARTALDWFVPVSNFHFRATVSTDVSAGILLVAGSWAAWRSGSFVAGAVAGLATAALASIMSILGVASLLLIWHDPQTMVAIRGSGGLQESFSLPLTMLLPGALLGTVGGVAGAALKKLLPA